MKVKYRNIFCALLCGLSASSVNAGEVFSIKAFSSLTTGPANYTSSIDVIATANINCAGTVTDKIRISAMSHSSAIDMANAGFLSLAEVTNAAKAGYVLETIGTVTFSSGFCNVTKFYIYVQ